MRSIYNITVQVRDLNAESAKKVPGAIGQLLGEFSKGIRALDQFIIFRSSTFYEVKNVSRACWLRAQWPN